MDHHGLQGDSLPHHGLHHELQGNLCSNPWSTSSSSSFTDFGVCGVFSFTYSYSSPLTAVGQKIFFPLLKCIIPEVLPPLLMGSALASDRSALELADIGSIGHGGSFWQKPPL